MALLNYHRFSAGILRLRYAAYLVLGMLLTGVAGLMLIEGYGLVDALYMTAITVSTVGFGEVQPLSPGGRLFLSAYIIVNVAVVAYALAVFSSYIIEGKFFQQMQQARTRAAIRKLSGHTIVCGYGRYGREIVDHLLLHHLDYVVIDQNEERLENLRERHTDALYIDGDATQDSVLFEANIEEASSLITALKDDSDNLYIVLSARDLNPGLRVVSSARDSRSRQKLLKAGASNVILPEQIGGFYMATLVSKPSAVEFFSFITNELAADIGFEELRYDQLPEDYRGRAIAELSLRSSSGVNIIGHRTAGGKYQVNPGPETVLEPGGSFIAIGNPAQIGRLRELFNPGA